MARLLPLLLLLILGASTAEAQTCEPRSPLPKGPVEAHQTGSLESLGGHRLVVKFADAVRARADDRGGLVSETGSDLATAMAMATAHGATFRPLLLSPAGKLTALQDRAERRSGRCQPDLAGMMRVVWPGASAGQLEQLGERLQVEEVVEFAAVVTRGSPPPTDVPPETPDLVGQQTYHGPDPGLDMAFAWTVPGGTGAGVRVSDCEYAWNPNHEDLNDLDLQLEPGQTIHPDSFAWDFDEHGISVLGELVAPDNGYGCTGLVPDVEIATYPEWTLEEDWRRETAITNALADSEPGDVVLLEMQTPGPGGDYGPAELEQPVWLATRTGVDAGVIVVAAAGNGDQDLDSPPYANYMSWGDSGAIVVGAGTADANHGKMYFSTHGSRVDVHAWGEWVTTLGYGDLGMYGGAADQDQYYTAEFAGTSSASPMVAAACASIQGIAMAGSGAPLGPEQVRELLAATGIPQGSGAPIGPFVDMAAALAGHGVCSCDDGDGDGWRTDECVDPLCLLRGDCDDGEAGANPGEAEVCGDGLDNDCDGATDGDDEECAGDDDTGDDDTGDDDDTYDDDDDGDDDDASTTTLPDDTLRVGSGCGCDTTARPFRGGLLGVMLLAALSRRRR